MRGPPPTLREKEEYREVERAYVDNEGSNFVCSDPVPKERESGGQ